MSENMHQLKAEYEFLATRTEDLASSVSGFESGLVKCNQESEARVQEVEQRVAAFETWLSVAGVKDMEERLVEHGKRMASWEEEILRQLAGTKSAFKDLLSSISGVENGLESVSRDFNERLSAVQEGNSAGSDSHSQIRDLESRLATFGSDSHSQIRDLESRLATFECRLDLISRNQNVEAVNSQLTIPSQDWKPQLEDLEARLASFDGKLERLSASQRVDASYEARLESFESRLDKLLSQKPEEQLALRTQKPTEVERELGNAAYRGAIETELRSAKATMQMQLTQHKLEFTTSLQDARQSMEECAARFCSNTQNPDEQISKLESDIEECRKTWESRLDESCSTFEVRLAAHVLDMDSRLMAYQNQLDKFVEARLGTHIQEAVRQVEDVDKSIKSFQLQLDAVHRIEDMDARINRFQRQPYSFDVTDHEDQEIENIRQHLLAGPPKAEKQGHSVGVPIYQGDSPRQAPTPVIIPRLASPVPSYIPMERPQGAAVRTFTPSRMVSARTSSPMISAGTPSHPPGMTSPRAAHPVGPGPGTPLHPPGMTSPLAAHPSGRAPSPAKVYVTQRVAAVPSPMMMVVGHEGS